MVKLIHVTPVGGFGVPWTGMNNYTEVHPTGRWRIVKNNGQDLLGIEVTSPGVFRRWKIWVSESSLEIWDVYENDCGGE